jgi:non-homologous end joining protein Ku
VKADAVALATKLIDGSSGPFQPEKMRDEYAVALHELVQAKLARAPEVPPAKNGKTPKVVNRLGSALSRSGKDPRVSGRALSSLASLIGRRSRQAGSFG